jgi:hypothetical protein
MTVLTSEKDCARVKDQKQFHGTDSKKIYLDSPTSPLLLQEEGEGGHRTGKKVACVWRIDAGQIPEK